MKNFFLFIISGCLALRAFSQNGTGNFKTIYLSKGRIDSVVTDTARKNGAKTLWPASVIVKYVNAHSGGGGSGANFANTDLTATDNRNHQMGGYRLTIQNSTGNSFYMDNVYVGLNTSGAAYIRAYPSGVEIQAGPSSTGGLVFRSLPSASDQDRLIGQRSANGAIGYITIGYGVVIASAQIKTDTTVMATKAYANNLANQVRTINTVDPVTAPDSSTIALRQSFVDSIRNVLFSGGGGAWTKLVTDSVTNAATCDIDFSRNGWDTTYTYFQIKIYGLLPATNNTTLLCRFSTDGTNYDAGATDYVWKQYWGGGTNQGTNSYIQLQDVLSSTTARPTSLTISFDQPSNTAVMPQIRADFTAELSSGGSSYVVPGVTTGRRDNPQRIKAIRLLMDSGNLSKVIYTIFAAKK